MEAPQVAAGLLVGLVVGMTGIGGGALMTPVLILVFGIAPATAVGTDLWFAFVTKLVGVWVHRKHGSIDWQVVGRLAAGSLPAAIVTLWVMAGTGGSQIRSGWMVKGLALALLITAIGLFLRDRLNLSGKKFRTLDPFQFKRLQAPLTVIAGMFVGTMVALTSVGAGALGTVALVYLYPFRLSPAKLVGTDLAHAIPLAVVAGAGHLFMGNIEWRLLANLLTGSIPGVLAGTMLGLRVSDRFVRHAIATVLIAASAKILL